MITLIGIVGVILVMRAGIVSIDAKVIERDLFKGLWEQSDQRVKELEGLITYYQDTIKSLQDHR